MGRNKMKTECIGFVLLALFCLQVYAQTPLTLNFIQNATARNAVCNDGTPGGYWFRQGTGSGSNRWLIHLQGGFWCWDSASCSDRWKTQPYLMSSSSWAHSVQDDGL